MNTKSPESFFDEVRPNDILDWRTQTAWNSECLHKDLPIDMEGSDELYACLEWRCDLELMPSQTKARTKLDAFPGLQAVAARDSDA